ncbi:hypothetical protein AB0F81_20205 [Actinoplanes sp. NPDC024001]|uniref:hypothetical protein n=1 Tax=Actinoplanes sp. NPDC024001 TaxID=3154598 RepID=UPI0033FB210E
MELPADFTDRVRALRDPERFRREVLDMLHHQEQIDARQPAVEKQRRAWAALEPELARRYADAIAAPWAQLLALARPTPQLLAEAAAARERLQRRMGGAPDALEIRALVRVDRQRNADRIASTREREKIAIRNRLAAAGLPFLPDLFLPVDRPAEEATVDPGRETPPGARRDRGR